MRAAVFAVEQIGIDCDRTVAGIQKEQFIGQREKIFTGILGSCINSYALDGDTPSTCATISELRNSGRSS